MRVSVIGAGAVGGALAAGLVRAGASVRVLARGASYEALARDGLWLDDGTSEACFPVEVTQDAASLRGADLLLLGVKAHDLPGLAPRIAEALGPETAVLPAINGLPWWFFDGFGGPAQGMRIDAVDPCGVLSAAIPTEQIVGCVVYVASYMKAPGRVRLVNASKLWLGDVGGATRAESLAEFMRTGGIPAEATDRLHWHVWSKLWGNSTLNPLSALTRAEIGQLLNDPYTCALVRTMMREMASLGAVIGLDDFDDPDARIASARRIGSFKTSMLQDIEAGRPIELEPILGALVELAQRLGHPTPAMDGVYGQARLLDMNLRV